ncbi:unnamed protein product [Strongylus vulgaris]|uniref:Uncharacterized protein n=1 Tax=Strongylus vulgaris TaxID=40348 RepID=A0A3P7J1F6_STRVU|nr:unnamed protein product [Strongylus vulgaris]
MLARVSGLKRQAMTQAYKPFREKKSGILSLKLQIAHHSTDATKITLVGASFGGTMAAEISNYLNVPCDVIAIDSGNSYDTLKEYSLQNHVKNLNNALPSNEIDEETRFWMQVNSWDLLQMLSDYNPRIYTNIQNFHIFSVDGSDLGWGRFATITSTRTIGGAHADMLSMKYSAHLATEIVDVLKCS